MNNIICRTILLGLLSVASLAMSDAVFAERFTHHSGVGFDYPQDWLLVSLDPSLLLVPPNTVTPLSALPAEYFVVGAEAVPPGLPVTSPDIAAWFDGQIIALDPKATRISGPLATGDGAELRYSSASATHTVRVRVDDHLGLFVVHGHAGAPEYGEVFDSVFATYLADLNLDSRLFGRWTRRLSQMTDIDYSDAGTSYVSASSWSAYVFQDNGRFEFDSSASVYSQGAGSGGTTSLSTGSESPSASEGGTWSASDGQITFLWDGGDAAECSYSLIDDVGGAPALKLQCQSEPWFFRPG